MARQKMKFRWKCPHCDRRNVQHWVQTMEMPMTYGDDY